MTPEQKKRAIEALGKLDRAGDDNWSALLAASDMAVLLQELIDAPEQAGVPDGLPTEEMTDAFAKVFNVRKQRETFAPAVRAMLAAAPQAQESTLYSAPEVVTGGSRVDVRAVVGDVLQAVQPDTRMRVKLGSQFGADLNGHWFYLQPADEYAEAALAKRTGNAAPAVQADMVSADDLAKLLPYGYYMDQPDGGSPTVLEQVARMAEDAARYRYLRNDCAGFDIAVAELDDDGHESWVHGYPPDELDAAIDAARAAQKGGES